ncbi:MAG: cation transporter [Bacteroidaceae bacterium]|nr:cation transporter [Bacteroidaceae bacterium]
MGHHHHSHEHHHHHHMEKLQSLNTIFVVCIAVNLLFVVIEAGIGFFANSLSLLSDAGHNLSDVFSLLLVLIAFRLAKIHPNANYTFGYKKSTVLISLLNAIILLVAVGFIVVESIYKFRNPTNVDGSTISWTAGIGIIINGLTAVMLMRSQKTDLNVRGAYLHMVADTLVSVGVVVSGLVISMTGWYVVDPIVSLVIAVVILVSTWRLLSDSLRLSLDGMPEGLSLEQATDLLRNHENVVDVHHVHIWAISTTDNALTAHVVVNSIEAMEATKNDLKQALRQMGIGHSTLEFETTSAHCADEACSD